MRVLLSVAALAAPMLLVGCASGTPDAVPAAKTGTAIYIVNTSRNSVLDLQVEVRSNPQLPLGSVILNVNRLGPGDRKLVDLGPYLRGFTANVADPQTKTANLFVFLHYSSGLLEKTIVVHQAANGEMSTTVE